MIDRILTALTIITSVNEEIETPAELREFIVKLIKEAEQCIQHDHCVICLLSRQAPPSSHTLEEHHVAGKESFPDTVTVCERCHAFLSDHQRAWQSNMIDKCTRLASYFNGWADIFELLSKKTGKRYFGALATKFRAQAWHVRNNIREARRPAECKIQS